MTPPQIKDHCALDDEGYILLKRAVQSMHLSARAYDRMLRLSRTIADLDNSDMIQAHHLAEALQYRAVDKLYSKKVTTSSLV